MTLVPGKLPDWLKDGQTVIVPVPDIRQTLSPNELKLLEGWEKSHGRKMTDQEIRCATDEFRRVIGEL